MYHIVLILGQLEHVVLLFGPFDGMTRLDGHFLAVLIFLQLGFGEKGFVRHAIPTAVLILVDRLIANECILYMMKTAIIY